MNKKALDQYQNFAEQREALIERKAAVDKGAESIRELIAHLDAQKDEALERTFKDVSRHFEQVRLAAAAPAPPARPRSLPPFL